MGSSQLALVNPQYHCKTEQTGNLGGVLEGGRIPQFAGRGQLKHCFDIISSKRGQLVS